MKNKLSNKIFAILALLFISSIVLIVIIQFYNYNQELEIMSNNSLKRAENSFKEVKNNEIQKLSLALDVLLSNKEAKNLFIEQNTDGLYKASKPIFDTIKELYSITHFYYIMPEPIKTCFLRVHNRPKNNDVITRFTYNNAVETKNMSSGLELGKTAFALRVVKPYYKNKELIGYMEVGEEIDHFFEIMKKNTKNEFFTIVDKQFLDKEKWENACSSNPVMVNWDSLPNNVVLNNTSKDISLSNIDIQKHTKERKIIDKHFRIKNKIYILGTIPLIDAGDRNVGSVYFTHDITNNYNNILFFTITSIIVFFLLFIVFSFISFILLKKTIITPIRELTLATKKIANKQINFRLQENRKGEVGELYKSINLRFAN